jgi:outer membrane lipoprotein-sorting protein
MVEKMTVGGRVMPGLFVLLITEMCVVTNVPGESVSKDLLRQGANHSASVIRDASVRYVFKQHFRSGWKVTKDVSWAYKPGKEFIRAKRLDENGEISDDTAYYYDGQRTIVFVYPPKNTNERLSAIIKSQEYVIKTIPLYPPTALFLRFWPVGISLDQILANERVELLPQKGTIGQAQCYVVELKSVGGVNENLGYKVWIDPDAGFLPRRIEIWSSGRLSVEIGPISLQNFGESIWFPSGAEGKTYQTNSEGGRFSIEFSIEMPQVKINEGLAEDTFVPPFEPGMHVYDEVVGQSYTIP